MARLVVAGVVGVAVGVLTANPAFGFQAAALTYGVTGFLDPAQKLLGPKLADLKAPQATYGSPIPYIEGAPRLAGVFFWASDKRAVAHTEDSGGKGGPGVESTTYSYEIDALYGLAINECDAIRRVWSNGKLVWSNADDADGETVVASASTNSWRDIRFYSGAADQLPDPVYEAAVGVGNAPAYRGRATVFIEGLNLGGSGQLPVLTFEVLRTATTGFAAATFATFTLETELNTAPFLAGITAMQAGGFDFLYGFNYDSFAGGHYGFHTYHVDQAGSITQTGEVIYSSSLGSGSGKEGNALQGNSDVSVLVVQEFDPGFIPHIDFCTAYHADGTGVQFNIPISDSAGQQVFSQRGDRAAFMSDNSNPAYDKKVRIFNSATGGLIATSAPMATGAQFIAIGDGVVYALDGDISSVGNNVFVVDLETGALLDTIATPITATQAAITCDENGNLYLFSLGGVVYKYSAGVWTNILTEPLLYATPGTRHAYFASEGVFAVQEFDPSGMPPYHERFYLATRTVAADLPTLADVVSRLCLRTKQLTAGDIDVTDLVPYTVRAMALTNIGTTRQGLESLLRGYFFGAVEGAKIKFVVRGAAPALTIPYRDLGAGKDTTAEPLPIKRVNDNEIPALISVRYANVENDFQDGLESGDRLATESVAVDVIELPLGFTPTEAKRIADAFTMDQAVAVTALGPVSVTRKYAKLEPTDVVLLTNADASSTYRARITNSRYSDGAYAFDLALDDATAINSAAATDSSYVSSTNISTVGATELELLDIPILRDVDNASGFYAVTDAAAGRWPGAEIDKSLDDVTYTRVAESIQRATVGRATSVLGDFTGGNVFDEVNSVTVDLGTDATLSSSSRAAMLATGTTNAMLLGDEIIRFRNATYVSDGVYTLTGLLRGRRGTEWATGTHAVNERAVLLQTTGMRRIADNIADRNVPYYWKAVTFGRSRDGVAAQTFANSDVGLKPFAPVDLRLADDGSGGRVLTWHRRSRLSGRLFQATPPALGEASEAYEVDIADPADDIIATLTTDTNEVALSTWIPRSPPSPTYTVFAENGGGDLIIAAGAGFLRLDATDRTVLGTATIGDGLSLYAYTATGFVVVGTNAVISYINGANPARVKMLPLASITGTVSPSPSHDISTAAGDVQGLAYDGTNVWITGAYTGTLKKLSATDLSTVTTFSGFGGLAAMTFDATTGDLFVCERGSPSHVREIDRSTGSIVRTFDCGYFPSDCAVIGGTLFVVSDSGLQLFDIATGILLTSRLAPSTLFIRSVYAVDTNLVAVTTAAGVVLLDSTGAQQALIPDVFAVNGKFSAGKPILGGAIYEEADLASGYSATVYQMSAAVGRGYPATLEF